jgi:ABC-2 type transport system ATP-binding protein
MDDEVAISVEHVSKTFKLPHERQTSVKSLLINLLRGGSRRYERQMVLKDISFEVKKGEFFGIVGRNGSGKSTLLKMLAGIYMPLSGTIQVNGKLTPFIELGVGFNPELTGRENVFLNGALLGFNHKEMEAMYHDIVSFAELEKFMDQKLKNYSSGMQVRLAFSIAIRAKSDILILDEVLAVGDEAFQQKCLDIFDRYKSTKQTVVLVTHDMGTVARYCDRAMLINKGDIVEIGKPAVVANKYSELNQKEVDHHMVENNTALNNHDLKIAFLDTKGRPQTSFSYNDEMIVELTWPKEVPVLNAGVAIMKQTGEYVFSTNTTTVKPNPISGNKARYKVKLNLLPGRYFVMAGIFGKTDRKMFDFIGEGPKFTIKKHDMIWQGITRLDHEWLSL